MRKWTIGRNSVRCLSGPRPMSIRPFISAAAQAGLYARYGVDKHQMEQKLSGIYLQDTLKEGHLLFRGFDDSYVAPHSRYTEIYKEEILENQSGNPLRENKSAFLFSQSGSS